MAAYVNNNVLNAIFNTDTLRKNISNPTPKRRRTEKTPNSNVPKPKFNGPKPKIGTKTAVTGLSVIAQPKRVEKPAFSKAIWVSRLNPATSSDEITKYILENTPIDDNNRFNVHKLVKKDQDLSLLKFVSFKVELNDDDFELLNDEDCWPADVMVREFVRERKLGDFFPDLNQKRTRRPSTEAMDTAENNQAEQGSSTQPSSSV